MQQPLPLLLRASAAAALAVLLGACSHMAPAQQAATPITPATWQGYLHSQPLPSVLLLGEQHDAPEHQQWQAATVQALAQRQQLAALVLEMADSGHSTQGLVTDASEADVQKALQWNDKGWPWKAYGPVVMAAVQAGVPVWGGNLPRSHMRDVMQQPQWDAHLPDAAWQQQRSAIRTGHCDLLPEAQITPMARIQLAKDASMARVAAAQVQPGRTVVMVAGRGHVLRSVGIPTWLPQGMAHTIAIAQAGDVAQATEAERDVVVHTPAVPHKDRCAALRAQWGSKQGAVAPAGAKAAQP